MSSGVSEPEIRREKNTKIYKIPTFISVPWKERGNVVDQGETHID